MHIGHDSIYNIDYDNSGSSSAHPEEENEYLIPTPGIFLTEKEIEEIGEEIPAP